MVFLAKQEIGFYYEVVFGRSVEEGAFHVQAVRFCSVLQSVYFERVLQVNRIKDGFDVVVSVGTLALGNVIMAMFVFNVLPKIG